MKVLALNSSARAGDVSKTEIMLDCLVEGMRDAGAEVEIINLAKKKIKYCIGCFTCWTKTPGKCVHKDDMTGEIYPKYLECDLCVLATPLYHFTVNAQMKTFIERTLPMVQPFFVERDGVTMHPLRHEMPPAVVISVAGFPEESVFDQLKSYMNFLYGDRLVAQIYRASCEMLKTPPSGDTMKDILEATVQGGRELVKTMKISPRTLARIKKPMTSFNKMAPVGNLAWQTCIDEGVTMGQFQKRGMVPRPNSIETYLAIMKMAFNRKKAGDARAVMQYRFTGQVEGDCYLKINKGKITAAPGSVKKPDLTIESPFEVWMDILTRRADGAQMLMEGRYKAAGNTELLMKMGDFFGES
ncbi:MAG: NAD(P)H-dependent oxidoreductase [Deltaproteobacteria bacterium]|nr:NAD(P)H-dependent oxidoreductase [Deltaproteobacteria bacterium]